MWLDKQYKKVLLIPSVPTVKYVLIPEEWYHITRYNLRLRWVPSKVNFKNRGFQTKLKPIVITVISLSKSIV